MIRAAAVATGQRGMAAFFEKAFGLGGVTARRAANAVLS